MEQENQQCSKTPIEKVKRVTSNKTYLNVIYMLTAPQVM